MKIKDKNQYDLTSKVILLTGAAGILGEKIASDLAQIGIKAKIRTEIKAVIGVEHLPKTSPLIRAQCIAQIRAQI